MFNGILCDFEDDVLMDFLVDLIIDFLVFLILIGNFIFGVGFYLKNVVCNFFRMNLYFMDI